jgi:hypothetical protein
MTAICDAKKRGRTDMQAPSTNVRESDISVDRAQEEPVSPNPSSDGQSTLLNDPQPELEEKEKAAPSNL